MIEFHPGSEVRGDDRALRRMFNAALLLAVAQAIGRRPPGAKQYPDASAWLLYSFRASKADRADARAWFREADERYRLTCRLAGHDPDAVRDRVLDLIEGDA